MPIDLRNIKGNYISEKIKRIRAAIEHHSQHGSKDGTEWNNFSDARTKFEVSRGSTYAFFPELQENDYTHNPITVDRLRKCLKDRGIEDNYQQDVILNLMLQNKSSLSFGIYGIMQEFMSNNTQDDNYLITGSSDNVSYVFNKSFNGKISSVDMIIENNFKATKADDSNNTFPALKVVTKVRIPTERNKPIIIKSLNLSKLTNNTIVNELFKEIEKNQSFWQAIKNFFKDVFGKIDKKFIIEDRRMQNIEPENSLESPHSSTPGSQSTTSVDSPDSVDQENEQENAQGMLRK